MPEKLVFFEKADVNGANAREVFSFLKRELPNPDGTSDIRWNFCKGSKHSQRSIPKALQSLFSLCFSFCLQLENFWWTTKAPRINVLRRIRLT